MICLAVSFQLNILHPQVSIKWKRTAPPSVTRTGFDLQCVLNGQDVFVTGWKLWKECDPVLVYDIARDSWDIHSWSPLCSVALTSYHSQLVLIGGQEIATHKITNSVLVWQDGKWQSSLPPMTLARHGASAVSSAKHIIVAGGLAVSPQILAKHTDTVEVFDGHSWSWAQSLPKACSSMRSVLHNDEWYICNRGGQGCEVFRASVQSIVDSTHDHLQSPVWSCLPPTPYVYCSIVAFGQQLSVIREESQTTEIRAYYPVTQSWVCVESFPVLLPFNSCALTIPSGDLMIVTWDTAWIGQLTGMWFL